MCVLPGAPRLSGGVLLLFHLAGESPGSLCQRPGSVGDPKALVQLLRCSVCHSLSGLLPGPEPGGCSCSVPRRAGKAVTSARVGRVCEAWDRHGCQLGRARWGARRPSWAGQQAGGCPATEELKPPSPASQRAAWELQHFPSRSLEVFRLFCFISPPTCIYFWGSTLRGVSREAPPAK